jgi:pyruvate dehydrogenase E2 component (dihydrolipoamide acetyltransferase)
VGGRRRRGGLTAPRGWRRLFSVSNVESSTPIPATAPGQALKGETTVVEPDRAARAIARRSAEIRATVPDLELSVDVDAAPLLDAARRHGCSTSAVLVAACGAALRQVPRANGAYRDGHYELYSRVNVAVLIQTDDAQTTATLLDADEKPVGRLDDELARLTERARRGELTPPEQAGATFTVSDLGPSGIHRGGALVIPPQAAALTAGAIRARPVVRDGAVVAGHELALTLACDHRILFGAQAARFLAAIVQRLTSPP